MLVASASLLSRSPTAHSPEPTYEEISLITALEAKHACAAR